MIGLLPFLMVVQLPLGATPCLSVPDSQASELHPVALSGTKLHPDYGVVMAWNLGRIDQKHTGTICGPAFQRLSSTQRKKFSNVRSQLAVGKEICADYLIAPVQCEVVRSSRFDHAIRHANHLPVEFDDIVVSVCISMQDKPIVSITNVFLV